MTLAPPETLLTLENLMEYTHQNSKQVQNEPIVPSYMENKDFFRSIWDVVECGILIVDVLDNGAEYRFAGFNPAFQRMSVVPTETLLGKTLSEALPDEIVQPYRRKYEECRRTGKRVTFEERFWVDGKESWWLLTVAPLQNETSKISQLVVTATDISERKAIETEYRNLVQTVNSIILRWDTQGNIVFINDYGQKLFGYEGDQLIGQNVIGTIVSKTETSGRDLEFLMKDICHHPEKYLFNENENICKNGEKLWISWTNKPIFDAQGNITEILSVGTNTSERKQAEAALQQKETFLSNIYNSVSYFVFSIDVADDGMMYHGGWNKALEDASGLLSTQIRGKTLEQIFGDVEGTAMRHRFMKAVESGTSITFEEQVLIAGKPSWFLTTLNPLKNEAGIYRLIGTAINIDERKAAEQALQESEERLRTVISSAPLIIYALDNEGRFTFSDGKALQGQGFKPGQVVGLSFFELYKDYPEFLDQIRQVLSGQEIVTITCTQGMYFEHRLVPIRQKDGEVTGLIGVALDISDKQAAQEQLHEQEQFLRSIYDGAQNPIFVVDVLQNNDFHYAGWNRATENITGIRRSKIRGKTPEELLGNIGGAKLRKLYTKCLQLAQPISFEDDFIYEDKTISFLIQLNPLFDDADKIYRLVGTCIDISERKQIEQALQISEARFRGLVENANDLIYEHTLDNIFTYVSPRVIDMFGRQAAELIGKSNTTYIHPEDLTKVKALGQDMIETGKKQEGVEFRIQHKNGSYIWVTCSISAVKDSQGNVTVIQGILRDISVQKAAEEALRLTQARLEYLISESPGVIYSCKASDNFPITFVSPNSDFVLGYNPEEFMQNPSFWIEKIHPEDIEDFFKSLPQLLEIGYRTHEYRFLHKNGNYRWIHDEVKLIKDEAGIPLEIIGHSFDITQRKVAEAKLQQNQEELQTKAYDLEQALQQLQRTQAQLVQSEKMSSLGQLVAGVAHEINNPVSFIYSNLEPAKSYITDLLHLVNLYQQEYPNPTSIIAEEIEAIDLEFLQGDLPKLLTSMKLGADRIKQIVLSLRNFSRMDEADYKEVNIHEGIDSTLIILEHRIKAVNNRPAIQVVKKYGNLPLIECYAGQLNQVFMNILSNALDALEERDLQRTFVEIEALPSCITIMTEMLDNNYIAIKIKDNGYGIPPEIQGRLFDPFFTTKPIGKGTGMGLSISYQIITEKHGGDLQCISSPTEGTTFIIQIPQKQRRK